MVAKLRFVLTHPREVVQEVYGWLLGHWDRGSLMFQVAEHTQMSPLRLSNTCTLNVLPPIVPKFQRLQPEEIPFFYLAGEGNFR